MCLGGMADESGASVRANRRRLRSMDAVGRGAGSERVESGSNGCWLPALLVGRARWFATAHRQSRIVLLRPRQWRRT